MDCRRNQSKFLGARNNKIYMDLKLIIREHALQFLPAKSLMRFRGVCRDWKQLISTPFFAHNQSLSFRSVSGLFFQNSDGVPAFRSLDTQSCGLPDPTLKFLPVPVDIISSSNGLLCCQAQAGDLAYYVCNPVTLQWKKLPKPNMEHGPEAAPVLIFKPSLLNFVAEFKLVCAVRSADFDDATEFEIYSSKDGSWKSCSEINYAAKKLIPKSGVYVNDVVYWTTYCGGILSYDLIKDRSQVMQGHYGTLGEMDGKLCSAHIYGYSLTVSVISNIYSNTMQMTSHAKLWENKMNVSLTFAVDGNKYDSNVCYIGSECVVFQSGLKVYHCDLKTKRIKCVAEAPSHVAGAPSHNPMAIPYVNSFVAL